MRELVPRRFREALLAALVAVALMTARVAGKKDVLVPAPIAEAVPLVACRVCEHAMFNAVRATLEYIADSNVRHRLREERLIDRVIDPLCVPLRPAGAWLRAADWNVTGAGVEFALREGRDYRCGRRCSTAAAACEAMLAVDGVADKITSTLIKSFAALVAPVAPGVSDADDPAVHVAQALVKAVCRAQRKSSPCEARRGTAAAEAAVPSSVSSAPPVEAMASKEVDIEEMMFRMKHGLKDGPRRGGGDDAAAGDGGRATTKANGRYRGPDEDDDDDAGGGPAGNPGVDVFSRDEMLQLREALRSGDRERLEAVDPTSADLSDDELAALSQMHRTEFGAPGRDTAAAATGPPRARRAAAAKRAKERSARSAEAAPPPAEATASADAESPATGGILGTLRRLVPW
jgi:hypothetical protein